MFHGAIELRCPITLGNQFNVQPNNGFIYVLAEFFDYVTGLTGHIRTRGEMLHAHLEENVKKNISSQLRKIITFYYEKSILFGFLSKQLLFLNYPLLCSAPGKV